MQQLPRLLIGLAPFEQIHITHTQSSWIKKKDTENLIDTSREKHEAYCQHKGIHTFDGLRYRVENVTEVLSGSKNRKLSTIRHRYYVAATQNRTIFLQTPEMYINHLSTGCLPITKDNYYVFGIRAKNGSYAIIGGGVQHDQLPVSHGSDLTSNLLKELNEELGITITEVSSQENLGIVHMRTSNVETISTVYLHLTKKQLLEYFTQRSDPELSDLIFLRKHQLDSFFYSRGNGRELILDLIQ